MKKFIIISIALICIGGIKQQQPKPTDLDKSPMDISYFPANYPFLKLNGKAKEQPVARVIYSRPQKNGRIIFDGIVKYNELWRLGANKSTELELFKNAKIGNKIVPKGKYTMYCIPTQNDWTIIVNKDNFSWGNFSYDSKKDVVRVKCTIEKQSEATEVFTTFFEEAKTGGANLNFQWDSVRVQMPIGF